MSNITVRMNREDRKNQILTEAIKVFVEFGYNGATTAQIAKAAGISEVTLFRHFDSKKDIFKLSIEPIVFTTLKESITASSNLTKQQQLEYILTERIKLVVGNHKVIKLLLMESQINVELEDVNYIDKMSNILKETIVEIGIQLKDDLFVTRLLMGAILSFLYMPEVDDLKIEEFVKNIIEIIVI